jgi:hypothetical protein
MLSVVEDLSGVSEVGIRVWLCDGFPRVFREIDGKCSICI